MGFSLIIPVYNDSARVKKCLQSLLSQTDNVDGYEIIVVDNSSEENIKEICRSLNQDKIKYFFEKKPGSYAARNKGIKNAKGGIFAFIDSDCVADSSWLKNARDTFKNKNWDLIGGKIELFFKDSRKPSSVELYEQLFGFRQKENIEKRNISVAANLFVKKEVFDKIGYFNDNLFSGGDVEFCRKAYRNNFKIGYSPNVIVKHPARHSLAEMEKKVRRVIGGTYAFNKKKLFFKIITPPVMRLVRVLGKKEFSLSEKMRVIGIIFIVNFIRFSQFFRMLLARKGVAAKNESSFS